MGSRGRKRSERRKRKERSARRRAEQQLEATDGDAAAANGDRAESLESIAEREARRTELKNREARAALEPLREGERPGVVTVAAVLSTLLFAAAVLGWLLWDVLRDDARPPAIGVLLFAVVVGTMAVGMWRARYWAVLGFQALLLFVMLGSALEIVRATTILQAVGNLLILGVAAALFYFMVKALARIQMPERAPRD